MRFALLGIVMLCCAGYALYRVVSVRDTGEAPTQAVDTDLLDGPFLLGWYNKHKTEYLRAMVVPVLISPAAIGDLGLMDAVGTCGISCAKDENIYVQAFYDQDSKSVVRARLVRFKTVESRLKRMLERQEFDRYGIAVIQIDQSDAFDI